MKTHQIIKNFLMLALLAFSIQSMAQYATVNDWTGEWDTNFDKMSLNSQTIKGKTEIKGTIGNYQVSGTLNKSTFSGLYSLNKGLNIVEDAKLKKSGVFKIELSFDKKTFKGTFTPMGAKKTVVWTGSKTKANNLIVRKDNSKINKININKKPGNVAPTKWTGTWELSGKDQSSPPTNVPRTMKAIYHDEENIEVQFYDFNPKGDAILNLQKIKLAQMHSSTGYSGYEYYMVGSYKFADGKIGRIEFRLDINQDPSLNTMSGIIMYPQNTTGSTGYVHGKNINVTGKRLSSSKPNFNNYLQMN